MTPSSPFDDVQHHGTSLRSDTISKVKKDYGRWLAFLASRAWLDPNEAPLSRVTVNRLRAYFRELQRNGNMSGTIIGRFAGLVSAMKTLAPGENVGWIQKIDGATMYKRLPKQRRQFQVPRSEDLLDWGLTMMNEAHTSRNITRPLAYRDGLLIALLTMRARRRRSLSLITTTKELFKVGNIYRVELSPDQVKTDRYDAFDVPEMLTPYFDTYLDVIRPALLKGAIHTSLWVGQSGAPLTVKGISSRIEILSPKRFGYAFGPHRFRHAISTMAAEHAPTEPGLAAAALDISPQVVAEHYAKASQRHALRKYAELIDRKLAKLANSPPLSR